MDILTASMTSAHATRRLCLVLVKLSHYDDSSSGSNKICASSTTWISR